MSQKSSTTVPAGYSIPEPVFCPFCHDVLVHRMVEDFNHFIQCLIEHARWWTLMFRNMRRIAGA